MGLNNKQKKRKKDENNFIDNLRLIRKVLIIINNEDKKINESITRLQRKINSIEVSVKLFVPPITWKNKSMVFNTKRPERKLLKKRIRSLTK